MLREFKVDLHIHTTLSPCGDESMIPLSLVHRAIGQKLNVIGICDHNSSENVLAVMKASAGKGLYVFGGMEITSREEVHVLAIFDEMHRVAKMQAVVYEHLWGENDVAAFGEQSVVDEHGLIVDSNPRLLLGATNLGIEEIVSEVHSIGGLAIASHVDKEMFSVTSQLGFIPEDSEFDALELSPHYPSASQAIENAYRSSGLPLVHFSDAHYLDDIGNVCTYFNMEDASIGEMKKALQGTERRRVRF
jgi:PHP family Zn ribbon phosphoesterase